MKGHGCNNCKYCKCYPGDYWTPDDYECISDNVTEEAIKRAWEDDETWSDSDKPICPGYKEYIEEEVY